MKHQIMVNFKAWKGTRPKGMWAVEIELKGGNPATFNSCQYAKSRKTIGLKNAIILSAAMGVSLDDLIHKDLYNSNS